jgi:hypothetical protein
VLTYTAWLKCVEQFILWVASLKCCVYILSFSIVESASERSQLRRGSGHISIWVSLVMCVTKLWQTKGHWNNTICIFTAFPKIPMNSLVICATLLQDLRVAWIGTPRLLIRAWRGGLKFYQCNICDHGTANQFTLTSPIKKFHADS